MKLPAPRAAGWLAMAVVMLLAGGCSTLEGDACADKEAMSEAQRAARRCDGGWFSAEKHRGAVYRGDDFPRLWTGEAERKEPVIDVERINQAGTTRSRPPITGFVGTLQVEIPGDPRAEEADLAQLRNATQGKIAPDELVSVKFENVTLDYFLKQTLGGALQVSYLAPDDLTPRLTVRLDRPVPKSQLLQVVRDILARNGLEMRFANGLYHIGRPDALAAMDSTAAAGRAGEFQTRLIRIRKGTARDVVEFVRQIVPGYVQMTATTGGNSVLLRAPPSEIDRLAELVGSMANGEIGEERVAIIPLQQTSPQRVVAQLNEFYQKRLAQAGLESVSFVPLDNQQAILVGTRDRRTLEGVRNLVAMIDRNAEDEHSLRVVPLVNLQAEEVVRQLTAIFGNAGGAAASPAAPNANAARAQRQGQGQGQGNGAAPARPMLPRVPQGGDAGTDESGQTMMAPGFSMSGPAGGREGGDRPGGAASPAQVAPPAQAPAQAAGIRFVADTRNNSVMVYSTASMFRRIREVVQGLDVPQAQVVIEVTILDVNINDNLSHGVQWYLSAQGLTVRSGTGARLPEENVGGGRLRASISAGTVQADLVLKALQDVTTVKVISSPYLTVLDGKTARLVIGDQIPYSTRSQQSSNNGTLTVTEETEVKDTGVILEVTPRINANDAVVLNISQSVSTPQPSAAQGNTRPVISTREMKSDVIVQSGRTILLGGLIEDKVDRTVSGVPVAQNLPLVGGMFKQTTDQVRRVELIAMITPRVIRNSSQIESITRLLRGQMHPR